MSAFIFVAEEMDSHYNVPFSIILKFSKLSHFPAISLMREVQMGHFEEVVVGKAGNRLTINFPKNATHN